MTPTQFITKWRASTLKEHSAAQEHFIDLCHLLGQPSPAEADPEGRWYTFEAGAKKTGGGEGWADVWKRRCFAWEYKGKRKDLDEALKQLQLYSIALENPPLLVVSDMERIVLHTNFTNTVREIHSIALEDFEKPETRQVLGWAFTEPERLRPGRTREAITKDAACEFARLALALGKRGFAASRVAHFINKLLFCMFAEDIGILPSGLFSRLLESSAKRPAVFLNKTRSLFKTMKEGGEFGVDDIHWFNGGLFDDDDVIPLEPPEIESAMRAARLDWSEIEPSIFGTLFERGLDPDKRSQLGAHYTDVASIQRIIGPVVLEPFIAEWEDIKAQIRAALAKAKTSQPPKAARIYQKFLKRLSEVRVLDPACGSGNFLYLALRGLKDLEHWVILEAEQLGLPRQFPTVGPEAVLGIEINPYAAELARVTVWIGEIQWMLRHGYSLNTNPILRQLDNIACRDALLNEDGTDASWPAADCIVGNPPFLGGSKPLGQLGQDYVTRLRGAFKGRAGWSGSGDSLVREGPRAAGAWSDTARRLGRHKFDSRRRESQGVGAHPRHRTHLQCLERRTLGQRRRGGASFTGGFRQ